MIYNLGSINADFLYEVPHLPARGETVAARGLVSGLGGKGANQSVAAARAGAEVRHIGAVGPDGGWLVERLESFGVDTAFVEQVETPTAHAVVKIDGQGENQIVIFPGSNHRQSMDVITKALEDAGEGDWLMIQNETTLVPNAAEAAAALGLHVAYSAAPFDARAVEEVLPHLTLLIMNDVEARQLVQALELPLSSLPVPHVLITKGRDGAEWLDKDLGETVSVPAFPVTAIDTTGAGDTFAGYMVAGLSRGLKPLEALRLASAAAALSVTRKGTADAIPSLAEVEAFLG